MARPTVSGDNVLTALHEQHPTAPYWQLTLLATLGGFLFGYDTSNIGAALNFMPYSLHGLALGYLVSGASLGAAAGAILGGPAADRFGRKALLITDTVIYAVGAILSAVTPDAAVLLPLVVIMIGLDFFIASFAVGAAGRAGPCKAKCFPPPSAARRPRSPPPRTGWPTLPLSRSFPSGRTPSASVASWSASPPCAWPRSRSCTGSCLRTAVSRWKKSSPSSKRAARKPTRKSHRLRWLSALTMRKSPRLVTLARCSARSRNAGQRRRRNGR